MLQNKLLPSVIHYANKQTFELLSFFEDKEPFTLPDFEELAGNYDAVIHIGMAKTGTSAIQNFLLDNTEKLKELGFYYPKHEKDKNNISGGHSSFGIAVARNNLNLATKIFEDYLSEAKALNLTLIISSESLYQYQNGLREIIADKNCKIIAFFRDPIDAICSHYNQLVKRHFITTTFETFCHNLIAEKHSFLDGNLFDCWQDQNYKNLIVLGYDPAVFKQIRIEYLFLNCLGIDERFFHDLQYMNKKINKSYTGLALELKRLLNFVLDRHQENYNHQIDLFFQQYSDNSYQTSHDFLYNQISEKTYFALKNKFKDSNQHLLDNVLITINPNFLKNDDIKRNVKNKTRYNEIELKSLLKKLFKSSKNIENYIKDRTIETLSVNKSYYILRLANILDIDIEPYITTVPLINENQMKVLLSENSQLAEVLTNVAVILENQKDYKSALCIIERALKLRPNGPTIKMIHERIQSKISGK